MQDWIQETYSLICLDLVKWQNLLNEPVFEEG